MGSSVSSNDSDWRDWAGRLERWRRLPAISYSIAVACVAVASATRIAIDPVVGDSDPFITYLPAVLIASLVAGFKPGLAAMALSAVSAWYFVLPSRFSLSLSSIHLSLTLLATFLCVTAVSIACIAIIGAVVERLLERHRALLAAQNREVERRDLLIQELEHRTRNVFGLVKLLANHSLKDGAPLADARASYLGRLEALAAAYNMDEMAGKVTLSGILHQLLQLHARRIEIRSCEIVLKDKALQQFSLIIHELQSNSMKYGALSRETGLVSISGNVDPSADTFTFTWQESGGPPVAPPSRKGFGQVILRHAPEMGGARISVEYPAEGLRYVYSNELSKISPDSLRTSPSV
jgi:two-component sensor histidine kinase